MKVCTSVLKCVMRVKGRSEATDFKVVRPHGVNGGEYDDQKGACE